MSNAQQISFGPAPAVSQFQQTDAGGLAFGDIDGDGDLDFIATGSGPSQGINTTIYTNDGLGNFAFGKWNLHCENPNGKWVANT